MSNRDMKPKLSDLRKSYEKGTLDFSHVSNNPLHLFQKWFFEAEETDAIVILISEERSQVSIAENSHFVEIDMDDIALTKYLNDKMFISSGD